MSYVIHFVENLQLIRPLTMIVKIRWCSAKMHQRVSSEVVIEGFHQRLSSEVVYQRLSSKVFIRGCHQRLKSEVVSRGCQQRWLSEVVISGCHYKLSSQAVSCCLSSRRLVLHGRKSPEASQAVGLRSKFTLER